MRNILQYIKEMMLIFGDRRTKLPGIVTLFFFVSLLDIAGLGLVAPFVSVVLNQANDGSGNGRIYQVFLFFRKCFKEKTQISKNKNMENIKTLKTPKTMRKLRIFKILFGARSAPEKIHIVQNNKINTVCQ